MWNIPCVIRSVWSKSIAERHGLLQHWIVNIFTSISLSLFMVSVISCFKVRYLILTLAWGVCKVGWPCFAERFSWPGRSYKQLVFMASLANVIFYCFPVAQGVSKMGFWVVFCFSCERVPRCQPDQQLRLALWGSSQCWGVTENLPSFSWLIFGLIFNFFFFRTFGFFYFSSQVGRRWSQGNKMATLGHFVPTPPFQGAGAGSAPAPGGWKSSWRLRVLISHWEALSVPGTFRHRHKGWKWCQLLKQRLCCFLVSSSPLLHFIQCSLMNQISSSRLRSLSSSSPRWAPFKCRHLAMLRNLWCKDISKFGGHHLGFSAGVITSHPEPW